MTDEELEIIGALAGVTFLPGHPHKRFARDMLSAAEHNPDLELSEKQHRYLIGLRWRYRRQIPDSIVGLASGVAESIAHKRRQGRVVKVRTKPVDRQPDLPLWQSRKPT